MVGKRKSKSKLSAFLVKRGLWLIFIEITIVGFAWFFDVHFRTILLGVIWSLGISMIVLALLIHFPRIFILIFSLLLIFCHNLFDNTHFPGSVLWAFIHEQLFFKLSDNTQMIIGYPIVPWIAVMTLGYYFGAFYEKSFDPARRQKLFNIIGALSIFIFVVLRLTNLYGDSRRFKNYDTLSQDMISFLNPSKYPPSLLYLLMTLGVTLLFLANTEKLKGRIVNFFSTFGRVPFFYYILHLYLIHTTALIFAQLSGFGWQKMILSTFIGFEPNMKGYGFSLLVVYLVWIGTILLLYPICKRFDRYKQTHRDKWWLSYL